MIITKVMLSNMSYDYPLNAKAVLLLASHMVENAPKLVSVDWLVEHQECHEAKALALLKKYYDIHEDGFSFIPQDDLNDSEINQALLLKAICQINEYTDGKRQYFDLPLDISIGTPFQQKVWAALQEIPYGKTISYAKLADNIGQPTAFRAVANANGKNPFSIIIPCHRVISSDGKLGGYTGGVDKKAYLLALEGVTYKG